MRFAKHLDATLGNLLKERNFPFGCRLLGNIQYKFGNEVIREGLKYLYPADEILLVVKRKAHEVLSLELFDPILGQGLKLSPIFLNDRL